MLPEHYLVTGGYIYYQGRFLTDFAVEVNLGKIKSIKPLDDYPQTMPHFKLENTDTLIPSFIDLHIHGSLGADIMDGTAESLELISQNLLKQGVCGFLATTMSAPCHEITQVLKVINQASTDGILPNLLGVHLEGPFIHSDYAGAQPANFVQTPSFEQFNQWQEASGDLIRQLTLAPEVDGAKALIAQLQSKDIILSAGHSAISCHEAMQSFNNGISHCTHLYNAMSGINHRTPGLAAAILLDDKVTAEIIADGVHIAPEMLKLTVKLLGKKRLVLVTDAMRAQGMGDGDFTLAKQKVIVSGNQARLENGRLAGSVLTMNKAVKNMVHLAGTSLEDAIDMATLMPACKLGIQAKQGQIIEGGDANFVVLDKQMDIKSVFFMGKYRS